VEPSDALKIARDDRSTPHNWHSYTLQSENPIPNTQHLIPQRSTPNAPTPQRPFTGRCRITITYADGLHQEIHYDLIPPEREQVRRLGAFHASRQWYTDAADPFHRAPSFMQYNRDIGSIVLQHSHTWFVGLSDEIGAGPSVAMAMKNLEQPDAGEVAL